MNPPLERSWSDKTPITHLKGIGKRNAERLARIGIRSVQDVLFHLPFRYQDRTRIIPISNLRAGDQAVVEGVVNGSDIRFGRRRSLVVELVDGTGALVLRLFHFSSAQQASLGPGTRLRCFGEVRNGLSALEMVHPEYSYLGHQDDGVLDLSLTPLYPTTEGMHQLSWRKTTDEALKLLESNPSLLPEWIPQPLLERYRLPELAGALRTVHRPPIDTSLELLISGRHPAQKRLAFEELLAHQLGLRNVRHRQRRLRSPALASSGYLQGRLLRKLPFCLTGAQRRVVDEISADLTRDQPMMRLMQGDVGSGKTVVSALAALQAVETGHQVALMAPTEILAEQHLRSFRRWLEPLGLEVGWLTGRQKGRARADILDSLAEGEMQFVVGTQALFQSDVRFQALGLVIIDEQHRFGVHQRMALWEKGAGAGGVPHQLIMTATPIPRTLAMTAYADLDLSLIDELPPGRTPVTTVVVRDNRRAEVIDRVRVACQQQRQVYWVCTLIEESESLQCQAAEDACKRLAEALPNLRIGMVHGRLKLAERDAVMKDFVQHNVDLLVATTVIEVGVDVPNASLMVIENPERLGLAQLHQLRGRVGRGTVESHCVLMYHPPLSESARQRLKVIRESRDGFLIAQRDLEIRGAGEVLGTRQTGEMQFRIADLLRHQFMLDDVQQAAETILAEYPDRVEPLVRRWVGAKEGYINA